MNEPVARTQMLIRKPIAEVFEAFVDPEITSRFWFTRGSKRLAANEKVTWHWDMYGVAAEVLVKVLERDSRILIEWPTPVEWLFTARGGDATFVNIAASGFNGTHDERVAQAIDSMGGFCFALAGCKAWLEHGVQLNLSRDHNPGAHVVTGA